LYVLQFLHVRMGPCTYRHFNFPSQMENEKNGKWTPIFHFPFTMKNET